MKNTILTVLSILAIAVFLIYYMHDRPIDPDDLPDSGFAFDVNWGQPRGILSYAELPISNGDTVTVAISLDLDVVHLVDIRIDWDDDKFDWLSDSLVTVSPDSFDVTILKSDETSYTMAGLTCSGGRVISSIDQDLLITKLKAKATGITDIILTRSVAYASYNPDTNYLSVKTASVTNDTCRVTIS